MFEIRFHSHVADTLLRIEYAGQVHGLLTRTFRVTPSVNGHDWHHFGGDHLVGTKAAYNAFMNHLGRVDDRGSFMTIGKRNLRFHGACLFGVGPVVAAGNMVICRAFYGGFERTELCR